MMARKRKTRGYNETNDEDDDGGRKYDVREKIKSERFDDCGDYLQESSGYEITLRSIQKHGFSKPMLVKEPEGLELRVPQKNFLVRDVRDCVGEDRIIDVMDVRTQKNIEMSMKEWCKYYESKRRDRLLNVISLEFSHTELDDLVEAPSIVRLLDWVDQVWPKFLKMSQTESTNKIDKMKYPKVQKYCLMSVKGSYTDFHIDFGGTSVWYHILKGRKIFWMVPPTELNLTTFEEWTLSGLQQEVFFGDLVEECFRVELEAGNTFFIPSGWIHAVYTLEDSLVFGGNFLHSFGIENQLKVSKVEDATKVPVKFRYPFYTEIQWYVVQHYVHCLTGKDHLHPISRSANSTPEKPKLDKPATETKSIKKRNKKNDDEDDTETGSETEEGDNDKSKRKLNAAATSKKNKRSGPLRSRSCKKSNKPPSDHETGDDSETEVETEIDSDADELKKKKPATCRMTKNSLLRLQYEIEQPNEKQQTAVILSKQCSSQSAIAASAKTVERQKLSDQRVSKTPFDLDKFMYPHDVTRLNGWSSTLKQNSNQTSWSNPDLESKEPHRIHVTKYELNGLKLLVKHLSKLSGAKKHLPALIRNSRSLLDDCKKMIVEHENDNPELAVTGQPITAELLNPKKSDINQLIEQFFKPTETTAHDETQALKSPLPKTDLVTAIHQQRSKYTLSTNNMSEGMKTDEKKNSCSSGDGSSNRSETKVLMSPNKRLLSSTNANSTSATAKASTSTSATTAAGSTTSTGQLSRPKSPPTRPLSNNQYTSKTKKDNSLVLPGSFADLIAATSTEKKVFDVSAADVTSSLFGAKEPTRCKSSSSSSPQKSSQSSDPIDLLQSTTPSLPESKATKPAHAPDQDGCRKDQPPKANSPEPPKLSPPKRFINPAFKPQNKEKLIFASAPYVSPITVSSQSRPNNLYPWQSPAPHQQAQPNQHRNHNQPPPSPQKSQTSSQITIKPKHAPVDHHGVISDTAMHSGSLSNSAQASQKASGTTELSKISSKTSTTTSTPKPSIEPSTSIDEISMNDSARSLKIDSSINDSTINISSSTSITSRTNQVQSYPNPKKPDQSSEKASERANITLDSAINDISKQMDDSQEQKNKKPIKPRGPPKKSKEARQAIISSPPRPVVTTAQRYLITPSTGLPLIAGPSTAPMIVSAQTITNPIGVTNVAAKEKPKTKKANRQRDVEHKSSAESTPLSETDSSQQATKRQSVICGLVAPPIGSQASTAGVAKPTQQYLISPPLLFNTMPTFSARQLQHMQRAPLPIISAPMPSPLEIAAARPGARIVWATQPRPQTSAAMAAATVKQQSTSKPNNKVASGTSSSTIGENSSSRPLNVPARVSQPDNAALLSLATTALSTAPMSTTPTLSYLGGIRPSTGQAIMVSSATGQHALLTGQPFSNPFIPRLPVGGRFPTVGITATAPSTTQPNISTIDPRPTGQLVFARLPNQVQPRYLITQPYVQPRSQTPSTIAGQPNQTLVYATFGPTFSAGSAKEGIKPKKVKTR